MAKAIVVAGPFRFMLEVGVCRLMGTFVAPSPIIVFDPANVITGPCLSRCMVTSGLPRLRLVFGLWWFIETL